MNAVVSSEQKIIAVKIDEAKLRRDTFKKHLVQVEAELKRTSDQTSIYSRLAEVSQQLEELHKLGAGKLFWGDKYTNEVDLLDHLSDLRSTAKKFTDKIDTCLKTDTLYLLQFWQVQSLLQVVDAAGEIADHQAVF